MDSKSESNDTPKKFNSNSACVFYGSELTDSRKRTKLNGKVSDLPGRISSVVNVPLMSVNVDGYICNERCYRDLKRLEKILEDPKSLQQSLQEKFKANNWTKRCSFGLQNFTKCLRAVEIASPRDGSRKGKGCKMHVIRRDSTKTKSRPRSGTFGLVSSNCTFLGKKHFRCQLRGKYLSSSGNWLNLISSFTLLW